MNTHNEQYLNKLELVKFIRSLSPTPEWAKAIEDGLIDTLTFVVEFCQAIKTFDIPLPSPYSKEWCYLVYRVVEAMRRDDELRDNGQMKFCEEDDNNTIAHLIEHYLDQVQHELANKKY